MIKTTMADDLYRRGYIDAVKQNDCDARACQEWQDVTDALDARKVNTELLGFLRSVESLIYVNGCQEDHAELRRVFKLLEGE